MATPIMETVNGVELNHNHVFEGGTFVTNFKNAQKGRYEAAIKKAGMEGRLIVSDNAYYGNHSLAMECCSLHMVSGAFELSDFWEIFSGEKE